MLSTMLTKQKALVGEELFSSAHQPKQWWLYVISRLDYALQPIINIHTGECYGYEALLRNYQTAGFHSINELFDQAYCDKMLYIFEPRLLSKAIRKFVQIPHHRAVKLYFNVDNRVFEIALHSLCENVVWDILLKSDISVPSTYFRMLIMSLHCYGNKHLFTTCHSSFFSS